MNRSTAGLLRKALLFWLVFLVMYGLYRAFPVFPLSIICGSSESNFQHYKAGFFAYAITCAIEYLWNRNRKGGGIGDRQAFLYSRLSATVLLPWAIFLIWYLAPATVGQMSIPLEIAYANLSTLVVAFIIVALELGWETATYSRLIKVLLWLLALVSLFLYMRFTFGPLPWADVFVEPNWR